MKKVFAWLFAAWTILAGAVVHAEPKPVVVVSFAGYDALRSDVDFLGKISDFPELVQSMDGVVAMFTQFQGLQGLDRSKPWGYAVTSDDAGFKFVGFLPVTDTDKLLGALQGLVGAPKDAGDGVKSINAGRTPVFFKTEGKWAFLAHDPAQLTNLPADPAAWLGALPKDYDLAIQASLQNIPNELKSFFMDQAKMGMQAGLAQKADESDAQFKLRSQLAEQQLEQFDRMSKELDQITLGLSLDAAQHRGLFDILITAVSGSTLAREIKSAAASGVSKFAGFLDEEAVLQAHWNAGYASESKDQAKAMLSSFEGTIGKSIDDSDDLAAEEKKAVKEFVTEALKVATATIDKGVSNGGLAVFGEGPFTLVFGGAIADAKRLETAVINLATAAKSKPDDVQLKFRVAEHKGVTFHTLTAPWPESGDDDTDALVEDLLGDELELVLGFGAESIYLALGPDGIETLSELIDESGKASNPKLPAEFILALSPVLAFVADQLDDDATPQAKILEKLVDDLDESGKDKIKASVTFIPNGERIRYEVEDGVLRALGIGIKAAQQQQAGGAPKAP